MRENGFLYETKRLSLVEKTAFSHEPPIRAFCLARSYIAILHIAFILWKGEGRVK